MMIQEVIIIGYKPLFTSVSQQSGNYQKDRNRIQNCHDRRGKSKESRVTSIVNRNVKCLLTMIQK